MNAVLRPCRLLLVAALEVGNIAAIRVGGLRVHALSYRLADIAHHVIGCQATQEMRARNVLGDVASSMTKCAKPLRHPVLSRPNGAF